MKDDIRYSEFLFLRALESRDPKFEYININDPEQQSFLGVQQTYYMEMIIAVAEDGWIIFEQQSLQLLIGRLRQEITPDYSRRTEFNNIEWSNPRDALYNKLLSGQLYKMRVTYRGLRRIDELREVLKRDRILEHFGVLLDIRYFQRDLEEALHRSWDIPVSVFRLDLDSFKRVNDNFGHGAGDVVMKSYLEAVRETAGSLGIAYRGRGDEVVALIIGQEHKTAIAIAEEIRSAVELMRCEFGGNALPEVTASIGVATTPPESRDRELETLADHRQKQAKNVGKNRVIAC